MKILFIYLKIVKEQILRNIEEEFSTKSSAVQKSHASYIERLKSTMLRVMMSTIGMTSNSHKAFAVSYVDTQIKLNILYILDVFRNSLVNASACHAINISGFFYFCSYFS
jgi:hypothetical protein